MNYPLDYVPPKIWKWENENGGAFASINRPIAGLTHEKALPIGQHPFQLYSQGTPNGIKVTVMFEELLEMGHSGAEYDAWLVSIGKGEQFGSDFVNINPNSKIPALLDCSGNKPQRIFESGAILLYLAEKFNSFLPTQGSRRTEVLNWLFWQMSSAPYLGGGFGHFYVYAPEKIQYVIDRYSMEVKRQLDVLDRELSKKEFIIGDDYTIADISIWPWYGRLVLGQQYGAADFLQVGDYHNVLRWAKNLSSRPAVMRGERINRKSKIPNQYLLERHSSSDFEALDFET